MESLKELKHQISDTFEEHYNQWNQQDMTAVGKLNNPLNICRSVSLSIVLSPPSLQSVKSQLSDELSRRSSSLGTSTNLCCCLM